MLQESATDGSLLMRLPHIEEITHDAGNILPAADLLRSAFFIEPERLLIERGIIAGFTQMVAGLAGELRHGLEHPLLFGINLGSVAVPNIESFEQFGSEHFQLGFENMGAEVEEFFQALDIPGQRLGYRRGFVGIIAEGVHALVKCHHFKAFAAAGFGKSALPCFRTGWAKGLLTH